MILEEETYKKFGYYPSDLKPKAGKKIIVKCDDCGKVSTTRKRNYRALCRQCAMKGNKNCLGFTHTEETKSKDSAAKRGKAHPLFGTHRTDKQKAAQSAAMSGKNHWNYNGGKKIAMARAHAKRKQQLGYTLLIPLKEGEQGHHVTDNVVLGIPAEVHICFSGYTRKKHRTLVLQWLKINDKKKYKLALCVLAKQHLD